MRKHDEAAGSTFYNRYAARRNKRKNPKLKVLINHGAGGGKLVLSGL